MQPIPYFGEKLKGILLSQRYFYEVIYKKEENC